MRTPIIISILALAVLIGAAFGIRPLLKRPALATPTPRPEITITIPEGWRREQIAALVSTKGVCAYDDFLAASTGLEGSLFPDTYRFFPNTPCSDVVVTLTTNYQKRTKDLVISDDQKILASIVEREAITDGERATIAGVYANRMKAGMRLEADPTVQYGKDSNLWKMASLPETYEFWTPITRADYQSVVSKFNTYATDGMPPSPICNPGIKSLIAAVNPEAHSYYYFFHRNGKSYFSKTFAEHTNKLNTVAN